MNFLSFPLQVSWSKAFGLLLTDLLLAFAALLALTILMALTFRRFLMGGVFEARLKYFLLRYTGVVSVALFLSGLWIMWQGATAAGILVLVGAAVFALLQIPIVLEMIKEFAVIHRLGAHLWNKRSQIEKLQEMVSAAAGLAQAVTEGKPVVERQLSHEESKQREEIEKRFAFDRVMFRRMVYHHSQDVQSTEEMLKEAAGHAAPQFGIGPAFMAYPFEFFTLFVLGLGTLYPAWGFRIAAAAGVDWQTPAAYALAAGVVAGLALPTYRAIRLSLTPWQCLVCQTNTRRRVRMGDARPHICSEQCMTQLRQLYS